MKNKKLIASLMLLLAAVIWGLSYSVQSMASNLNTFTITFFKCIGGFVLFILALIKKAKFSKVTIVYGTIIGVVCFLGCALQQKGLELSSAANASFISALYIVIVPVLGIFIGKKANKKVWIAIVVALIGMYLLCLSGEFKLRVGDAILLAASFFFAIQIIIIDKYINEVDALAFTAVQQLVAALLSGIMMVTIEKPPVNELLNQWVVLLYCALISGAIAQFLQNKYQADLEPAVASLLMSFESVFGALFGWLLLNQTLNIQEIMGCVLIFIAIVIAE